MSETTRQFGGRNYVSKPPQTKTDNFIFPDDRVGNAELNAAMAGASNDGVVPLYTIGLPVEGAEDQQSGRRYGIAVDGTNNLGTLRGIIGATMVTYPTLQSRCDVRRMLQLMDEFGVSSIDTLRAVLADSAMVPILSQHLASVCPAAFVSLLRARLEAADEEAEEAEEDLEEATEATEEEAALPIPNQISRFMYVLRGSILEFMVPPDHMPWFKRHWIESRRDDSATLKEEFMFLAELELLFGSLLFGALIGIYYGAMDDATIAAFKANEVLSFGFWATAQGGVTIILSTMQMAVAYITIFIFLPVNGENFYAFAKTQTVENMLNFGTILIVVTFYSLMTFIALSMCNIIGSSWLALFITFGMAFFVLFPFFIVFATNCLNLALCSGVYGSKKIVPDRVAVKGARASDDMLVRRSLANIKKYGKPIPHDSLYGSIDEDDAGEQSDQGGPQKKKGGTIGRRSLRKKLVNHTHHAARIGMF